MLIRSATAADAAAVAAVHETARRAYYAAAEGRPVEPGAVVGPEPERRAMWETVLADPDRATVLVAEDAGRVAAFVSMGPPLHATDDAASQLEMHALYVLPAHWGGGTGSRLHDAFAARLREGRFTAGVLDVWSGNDRAIAFYRRRGWTPDGRSRPAADGTAYLGMALRPQEGAGGLSGR